MARQGRLSSERFGEALAWAAELHAGQTRKGTDTPYVAHLIAVASIVLEHGGDEDQAIAALLHDAIEDQGGAAVREHIRSRFGDRVMRVVQDCTDAEGEPKPPWRERKERYIDHLGRVHRDSLLVSMADKLHNAGAMARDYRRVGPAVFDRFGPRPHEIAWYYEALVAAYDKRQPQGAAGELLEELRLAVDELVRLTRSVGGPAGGIDRTSRHDSGAGERDDGAR